MTAIFRDTLAEKIAVGTTVLGGASFEQYLIVQHIEDSINYIMLLEKETCLLHHKKIEVSNPEWISKKEFEKLVDHLGHHTDYFEFENESI